MRIFFIALSMSVFELTRINTFERKKKKMIEQLKPGVRYLIDFNLPHGLGLVFDTSA